MGAANIAAPFSGITVSDNFSEHFQTYRVAHKT